MKKRLLVTRKRYIFLAIALVASALGLLFFDGLPDATRLSPDKVLLKSMVKGHFYDSDQIAEKIMSGDPSILLVDLRDSAQYAKYSLPGAMNIPYGKILDDDYVGYFDQDQFDVVLFSNDHLISEQSWIILTSKNFKNMHVLKGGLNEFFNTIIRPKEPVATAPETAFDQYNTRVASGYFFGVPMPRAVLGGESSGGVSETGGLIAKKKRKAIVIRKKKKKTVGGC
ncbi:MAG TPA: rhodanese-like domain-containing protein [Saprospiraceae bacterium]|nr:rhodanese-like domain-containing protein [Saprospiraceae bacterium]